MIVVMIVIMVMFLGHFQARWHAIGVLAVRDRHAQIAAIADIGKAAGHFPHFRRGIGQLALQPRIVLDFLLVGGGGDLAHRLGQDIAAGAQIVGLAVAAIDMDDEILGQRHLDLARTAAFVGGAAIGADRVDMDRLVRHAARDAAVDHIDHAADRRRSIEQGGRAAQHLDPVGGQRVDRDGMVDRGVGHIEAADAVG